MIDASEKPIKENIEITRKVVELAKSYDVNVEAELGNIPKPGSESTSNKLTNPKEAKFFVENTGVNSLAVAIGSKHGFYKGEPKLDLERLKKIRKSTDVCLVLHGGSGIPEYLLREAINLGIIKVNLATEIKDTFTGTLKNVLNKSEEIDLRRTFPEAINSVKELIKRKIETIS